MRGRTAVGLLFAVLCVGSTARVVHGVRTTATPLHLRQQPPRCSTIIAAATTLPDTVERLLPVAALNDRASTTSLWKAVRECYPTEADAVAAVKRNPALCLPWACSVSNIKGSYAYIVEVCGKDDALTVITNNPGALGNDPTRLRKTSSAAEIIGAAKVAATVGALKSLVPAATAVALLTAGYLAAAGAA